jgi:hypothetical protein
MSTDEGLSLADPVEPQAAFADFGGGRVVPLLPVRISCTDGTGGQPGPTWALLVHPNWQGSAEVELDEDGKPRMPSILVDVIPPGGAVHVRLEKTESGGVALARHLG